MSAATPPRTWVMPEEPPVGAILIDSNGEVWERLDRGWRWLSTAHLPWIESAAEWHAILRHVGPLREATPDDLARLGIEDPS